MSDPLLTHGGWAVVGDDEVAYFGPLELIYADPCGRQGDVMRAPDGQTVRRSALHHDKGGALWHARVRLSFMRQDHPDVQRDIASIDQQIRQHRDDRYRQRREMEDRIERALARMRGDL
jgi:hypothetical protein